MPILGKVLPITFICQEESMTLRKMALLSAVLLAVASTCAAQGKTPEKAQEKPVVKTAPIKAVNPASGKEMFKQYCAPCHGQDGKGNGPAAPAMKTAPTDLTVLTKHHDGKYPGNYVAGVLKFGSGPASHGSAEMPVWGPLFQSLDKYHDTAVQQRVSNLVNYIESIQVK
jgi:mono/diheme cytochrome c family protein